MPRQRGAGFRLDVEGLRGVAVLAVVLYHARLVTGGYVGVDVFFVLSGFLITRVIWDELVSAGGFSFLAFYGRRARRLLPAALVVLLSTVAASAILLSPLQARDVVGDAVAAALYTSNNRFAALQTDYLAAAAPSPVQHYWSLSLEEQFYLVWPVLLAVTGLGWRRRARGLHFRPRSPSRGRVVTLLVIVGVASFTASWWLTRTNQPWAFFSLPTRAWELVAGGLVALSAPRLRHLPRRWAALIGWGGALAVVASVLTFDGTTPFPGAAALAPVAGTAAVLVAGCGTSDRGPGRMLAVRPLRALGRISYPLYLWHWPAIVLTAAAIDRPVTRWEGALAVGASGVLAAATLRLVEDPVRYAARLVRSPRRSALAGAAATAAAVGVVAVIGSGLAPVQGTAIAAPAPSLDDVHRGAPSPAASDPARLAADKVDEVQRQVAEVVAGAVGIERVPANITPSLVRARRDLADPFVDGCTNSYSDARVRRCVYGDPSGSESIVLFGDSHAAQWFPALHQVALERGWRLIALAKATCPPVSLPVFSPVLRRPFRECDAWRAEVLRRIAAERPLLVVLGAARHYDEQYRFDVFGPEWVDGMASMVSAVRAAGAPVLVLGPTPKPARDVPQCLSKHVRSASACTTATVTAVNRGGVAAERAGVRRAGGRYADVAPLVCTELTCAVVVDNLLVFRDDNHLTAAYAGWLAPVLAAEVDAATLPSPDAASGVRRVGRGTAR